MPELLTEAELEVMRELWELERGTVRDVMRKVERDLAYTTIATTLRILETKGFARSEKVGRSFVYEPTLSRDAYEERGVSHMVRSLFGGRASSLVRRLLDVDDIDDAELDAIRQLLEKR